MAGKAKLAGNMARTAAPTRSDACNLTAALEAPPVQERQKEKATDV
jgi:hypothetical protein